ncbi:MAG TPA: F0F1 ATP synthase subunit alpha, partial [Thermoanaerobaculia bacterium]
FEAGLHEYLKSKNSDVLSAIVATGKLEKATEEALGRAIGEYKNQFVKDDASVQTADKKPDSKAGAKSESAEPAKVTT